MSGRVTDKGIEESVSVVLRTGVLLAAGVVLVGCALYLIRHGGEAAQFATFRGVPEMDRKLGQIAEGAAGLRARSIIQAGVLLLIATPIARVVVSLVGFAMEPDRKYVAITAIVLAVLIYSLLSGAARG